MNITIGASRKALRKFAWEIVEACEKSEMNGTAVDVTVYAEYNGRGNEEVVISVGNDDMENRTDLPNPDVILVDVDA